MFEGHAKAVIEFFAQARIILIHFGPLGPIRGLVRRESTVYRIDPEGEQMIKSLIERAQSKSAFAQQIPVEGFHMSQVKNNTVALWDWAVVHGFAANNGEEIVGLLAGLRN